jgi:nitrous oxide reductase accessory protein NosL
MKKFSFLFFISLLLFGFSACEKKPIGGVEKMHWDRDMCERCKMAISERKFAVQLIDPQTGKDYKFDDIGCAILWLKEEKIPWENQAIIWITDAKTGKWIDARKAQYVNNAITPMAYGFAAYSKGTLNKESKVFDYTYVVKKILEIEKENSEKVKVY